MLQFSFRLLLVVCLAACTPEDPPSVRSDPGDLEEAVRSMVGAVSEGRPGAVMDHVALGFQSEDGLRFGDVQAIVDTFLLKPTTPGARLNTLSVERAAEPPGARRVLAWVDFSPSGPLAEDQNVPSGGASYTFDVVFVPRDGLWKALRGSYRRQ